MFLVSDFVSLFYSLSTVTLEQKLFTKSLFVHFKFIVSFFFFPVNMDRNTWNDPGG